MRELRRVIFHRAAVFMLFLLTAIGGVLFWLHTRTSDIDKDYPALFTESYHALIEEYKDTPVEEISLDELDARADEALRISSIAFHYDFFGRDDSFEELLSEYPDIAEKFENGELQRYIDKPLRANAERDACETLKTQVNYLNDFNSYYPAIKKSAERMQRTSIFGDPSSYAYRNTLKTVKDFEAIDGSRGTLGDDRAVTSVFDDPIADYLMLLFMAAIALLMLKERQNGLWQLVRATPNGRSRLALSRILTLLVSAFLATVFIFGSRLVISYWTYNGLAYGSRLVQSVQGFNGIPFPMTVNAFVLIYCVVKVVCTFFAGLLLYLMLSSVKNVNLAIAITGAALALEFTLYSAVRDSSILVPFKYVNIFQLIVPRGFVVSYLNLNILEQPVNTRIAVSTVMSVLSVLAAVGIILVHVFKRPVGKANPLETLLDRIRRRTYKKVFLQETGKALFAQRGVLVIIVLVFIFLSFGSLPRPTVTDEQRSVSSYYRKYAGSVSEETLTSIDGDMETVEEKMMTSTDSFMTMNYQNTLMGLEYLREDVQDIIDRNASGEYSREIKLIPPYTYMTIFGDGSRAFGISQGLKALLCISLFTAGLYAYERQSGMTRLLRSLPNGRRRLFMRKELLTLVFSLLTFIAVYLPEIIALASNEVYEGFAYFTYPMQGLEILRESRLPLSVGTVTVLYYLARLIAIFLIGSAVGLLSALTDRVNTALVVACAAFAVPACIVAMGVSSLYPFTPLPLVWGSGAYFYDEKLSALIFLALLLAMAIGNYIINCARRTGKLKR